MSQCLNPDCLQQNPPKTIFCQRCGSKLVLQERYRGVRVIGEGGFGRTFLAVDEQRLDWHENYINAPTWPNNTIPRISNNNKKLLRGGSWINTPFHCRSAYRICADTEFSDSGIGLRIVSAAI